VAKVPSLTTWIRRHQRQLGDSAPYLQVVFLTIAITAVGTVVVLNVPWLPEEASAEAGPTDTLYNILAVASVFVFALVLSILIVSVLRFRRRFDSEADGVPIHGNTGLEVVWTAIPAVIMTVAAIASGVVLADIEEKKPGTKTIEVTGQQFAWTFDYQGEGVRRAGELHLVKDTPYLFKIRSKDVIHSFWVPEFRMKKDAVPGITTSVRVEPTRDGTYTMICAELCGLGHSTMRARVVVESQQAFDRWIEQRKQAGPPATPSS
jgi:cytochrome c oxidase subunit II